MFEDLEAEYSVKAMDEIRPSIKIIPKKRVKTRVSDVLRKELESLFSVASNVEYGVMTGASKQFTAFS